MMPDRGGRLHPGRSGADKPQDRVDVEAQALFQRLLRHQVALEDDRPGVAVRQVVIADGGDGQVKLDRIDAFAEIATGNPTFRIVSTIVTNWRL